MRVIVSDSSCLIDLRKAGLLDAFLTLPYQILIPNTLFEDDLLQFTSTQKAAFNEAGVQMIDVSGEGVVRAQQIVRDAPQLPIHDALALVLAEARPGCILVTGDEQLAASLGVEVQGVLWIVDELHRNSLKSGAALHDALLRLANHQTRRTPPALAAHLQRYALEALSPSVAIRR
jgi:hypothetical protein